MIIILLALFSCGNQSLSMKTKDGKNLRLPVSRKSVKQPKAVSREVNQKNNREDDDIPKFEDGMKNLQPKEKPKTWKDKAWEVSGKIGEKALDVGEKIIDKAIDHQLNNAKKPASKPNGTNQKDWDKYNQDVKNGYIPDELDDWDDL